MKKVNTKIALNIVFERTSNVFHLQLCVLEEESTNFEVIFVKKMLLLV